jgi:hypothetical protein
VHLRTAMCPVPPDPTSLPRRAPVLPRAPRLRTPPPYSGGLWCCHMSHSSRPRLPAREGSSATMCNTAPEPVSLLRRAPVLPCGPQLWTLPPYSGGLRCCRMPHDFRPCLLAQGEGLRCCHMSCDPQRVTSLKNKESLSCNGIQQGSHVSKTRLCVTEVPTRRAGRRYSTTL